MRKLTNTAICPLASTFVRELTGSIRVSVLLGTCLLGTAACASVPPEAVELSRTVGKDLQVVHGSYKQMVRNYFDLMRQDTIRAFDEKFTPTYLETFIRDGGLLEVARDNNIEAVEFWARTAVNRLDSTRRELLEPIDLQEDHLLGLIDAMFIRMTDASAVVTAHLASVRNVKEAQDKALEAVGLKDLRDEVNQGLIDASNMSRDISAKIEEADGKLAALGLGNN